MGNSCLKMEVVNQSARCHGAMGDRAKQGAAFARGLDLWRAAQGSDER